MLPTETHFRFKDTHRQKLKGCKKIFYANGSQKRRGVGNPISDKKLKKNPPNCHQSQTSL